MGLGGVGEVEDLGDVGYEGLGRGEVGDLVEPGALRAYGRGGEADVGVVGGGSQLVGGSDEGDQDAARPDRGQCPVADVASNEDQGDVDRLGDEGGQGDRVGVVDGTVGAEATQPVMLGGAGHGRDGGAEVVGDLHGEVPDAAAGTGDQDALAGRDLGGVGERLPRGHRRQRQSRRSGVGDRVRGGCQVGGRNDRVPGVGGARVGKRAMP